MTVDYRINPSLTDTELNALFAAAWPSHRERAFSGVLARSLGYIGAFDGHDLVAFVNIATDGGVHAFVLDPTVAPTHRRQGIGTELLRRAQQLAESHGCEWLHVDFEAALEPFYRAAGFGPTSAGLVALGVAHRTSSR